MSRAFVREDTGQAAGEPLPERALSPHRNLVTAAGLAQLEDALREWRATLSVARAADDTEGVARAERELRYFAARRASAELAPEPPPAGPARFGARIRLRRDDGTALDFRIVGEDEADPRQGKIAWVAPLAQATLGKVPGDAVEFGGSTFEVETVG
jgi:transcription elongation GreA/GreB family factor